MTEIRWASSLGISQNHRWYWSDASGQGSWSPVCMSESVITMIYLGFVSCAERSIWLAVWNAGTNFSPIYVARKWAEHYLPLKPVLLVCNSRWWKSFLCLWIRTQEVHSWEMLIGDSVTFWRKINKWLSWEGSLQTKQVGSVRWPLAYLLWCFPDLKISKQAHLKWRWAFFDYQKHTPSFILPGSNSSLPGTPTYGSAILKIWNVKTGQLLKSFAGS